MKYMKMGSKQDAFQVDGINVRYGASELATDIIVNVGDVKFYLHKFPLLSKSNRLQRLILEANEDTSDEVYLHDIPGGPKAFEICAKFCYGMIVTLNAYNVVDARCAAEYLDMTEDLEKGNLIFKVEVFLNTCMLRSWKDSIIVLQATKSLLPWSEELKVVGRCIDSIASKASVDPSRVSWSYTYNKKTAASEIVPMDWWVEDICELDVELYKRVMVAVKSKGRVSSDLIGEALKAYAVRWLPDSYDAMVSDDYARRSRSLVETVISLLPSDNGSVCSCSFLLKLLKVATLVGAGDLLKEELMARISVQLHNASVKDLLIPARSPGGAIYDVDLVQTLVSRFVMKYGSSCDHEFVEKYEHRTDEFILGHESLLSFGKLIDDYLAEVAADANLPLSSFVDLSASVPEVARPVHDGLYAAIDVYMMEHPELTKAEKKRICRLMDARKLSANACKHAALNERLPLRVVVQVLYFEQLRAATGAPAIDIKGNSERPDSEICRSLKKQPEIVTTGDNEYGNDGKKIKNGGGGGFLMPSRSRRIFGSSRSPPTSEFLREHKSYGSLSRHSRHSVS